MAKIKLTRNELKKQRENIDRYRRFLPTLELKKRQLEIENRKLKKQMQQLQDEISQIHADIAPWQKLFGEKHPKPLPQMVEIEQLVMDTVNVAGFDIPVLNKVIFRVADYDVFMTPPWIDQGIETIKQLLKFREQMRVFREQQKIIALELRKTTQRINLFSKRLIPECQEHIRRICIYLGDMQASAVGRAKIAKQKITEHRES